MSTQPKAALPVNPFQRLEAIVRRLRSPEGCPWDQRQTIVSLKRYLLEEAQELAEAIDLGDPDLLCEEAGDLHFVLALLLLLCEEQGLCSADQVLEAVCAKMLRRHPHVFAAAGGPMPSEEQLRAQWERIKQEERRQKEGQGG